MDSFENYEIIAFLPFGRYNVFLLAQCDSTSSICFYSPRSVIQIGIETGRAKVGFALRRRVRENHVCVIAFHYGPIVVESEQQIGDNYAIKKLKEDAETSVSAAFAAAGRRSRLV